MNSSLKKGFTYIVSSEALDVVGISGFEDAATVDFAIDHFQVLTLVNGRLIG